MTGKPFAPSLRWYWWRWRVSNMSQTGSRCRESSCPLTTIWSSVNSTITSHHLIQRQLYNHITSSDPVSTIQPHHTIWSSGNSTTTSQPSDPVSTLQSHHTIWSSVNSTTTSQPSDPASTLQSHHTIFISVNSTITSQPSDPASTLQPYHSYHSPQYHSPSTCQYNAMFTNFFTTTTTKTLYSEKTMSIQYIWKTHVIFRAGND